jgi:hypothetical protein
LAGRFSGFGSIVTPTLLLGAESVEAGEGKDWFGAKHHLPSGALSAFPTTFGRPRKAANLQKAKRPGQIS